MLSMVIIELVINALLGRLTLYIPAGMHCPAWVWYGIVEFNVPLDTV